jgi:Mg2+-importing ATPase
MISELRSCLGGEMKSEVSSGLTSEEAQRRLAVYGFNEPVSTRRAVPMLQFLRFFANPLVIILLIASLISAITGDVVEATIIIVSSAAGGGRGVARDGR